MKVWATKKGKGVIKFFVFFLLLGFILGIAKTTFGIIRGDGFLEVSTIAFTCILITILVISFHEWNKIKIKEE